MLYWIWLTRLKGIGPKRQRTLLEKFKNPENIYRANLHELLQCKGIGDKTGKAIIEQRSFEEAKTILHNSQKLNINLLTLDHDLYPDKAKNITAMPILLYYKGNLIQNSMGVGIVGSRRCSEYGKKIANDAAMYLAKQNISVISGMAKGIDGHAHVSCIKAGGYTVAILGNGLDICYPAEHMELMEKIIKNVVAISEYPPGTRPNPRYFPRRNLLISAWSHKILVIEAGEKSGSIITANYGKQHSREVFAVPDNIYRRESIGSNKLIYNGAKIYLNNEQLLIEDRYEPMKNNSPINSFNNLDDLEKSILKILLNKGTRTIEELSINLDIDNMELVGKLAIMELEGKVKMQGSKINTEYST